LAGFAQATDQPDRANQVVIVTGGHDSATRAAVTQAAEAALTNASIEVSQVQPFGRVEDVINGHVYAVEWILLVLAVVMAMVGCVGLASTISTNVLERTREFGVMHAIGAPPRAVRRIVVSEGLFMAVASCLIAVVPAAALTVFMNAGLGTMLGGDPLPFRVAPTAALAWIAAVVTGAVLATLAPAFRASRLTVRDALAHL
jgi:putative ABC transport system permease protein